MFLTFNIHNSMGKFQWNSKVIQTLHDVTLKAAGIRHQFRNHLNLGALQSHTTSHDQTNIAGTQDYNLTTRHVALDVNQSLCCTSRENTSRSVTRNIQGTTRSLTTTHGKDNSASLNLEETILAVHSCNHLILGNIHDHCVQLIFNAKFQHLVNKTTSIFRASQFFLKSMKTKSIVDALIKDTAKFRVSLQNQNIIAASLLR